jgi:hypothetical protein
MSETVDRLGVDVGVTGFSSFENHMRRVNELLMDLVTAAPKVGEAGDTIHKALEKIKRALGGAGIAGEAEKTSATTVAALNRVATASVETTAKVTSALETATKESKALAAENQKLIAKAATPNVEALKTQLKAGVQAQKRQIESVLAEANARMGQLGGNQQAEQVFGGLSQRLQVIKKELDGLGLKRTLIDPTMLTQVDDLGTRIGKMGSQAQKSFDAIGKTQAGAMEKSLAGAEKAASRQLVAMQRNVSSRLNTSSLDDTLKTTLSSDLARSISDFQAKVAAVRSGGGPVTQDMINSVQQFRKEIADSNRALLDDISIKGRSSEASTQMASSIDRAAAATEKQVRKMREQGMSRITTSGLPEEKKLQLTANLDAEVKRYKDAIQSMQSAGSPVPAKTIQSLRDLRLDIQTSSRSFNDLFTVTERSNSSTNRLSVSTEALRERLKRLYESQSSSIKTANLDGRQQAAIQERLQSDARALAISIKGLGAGGSAQDVRKLSEEITRLGVSMTSLVSETAKANRVGIDSRLDRESKSIERMLSLTETARKRQLETAKLSQSENQQILSRINSETQGERTRYAQILADSTRVGAAESTRILRDFKKQVLQTTKEINRDVMLERKKIDAPTIADFARKQNRGSLKDLSTEDFATGVIAKMGESSNAFVRTMARNSMAFEEAMIAMKLSATGFFKVFDRIFMAASLGGRIFMGLSSVFFRFGAAISAIAGMLNQIGRAIQFMLSPLVMLAQVLMRLISVASAVLHPFQALQNLFGKRIKTDMFDGIAQSAQNASQAAQGGLGGLRGMMSGLFGKQQKAPAMGGDDRGLKQLEEQGKRSIGVLDRLKQVLFAIKPPDPAVASGMRSIGTEAEKTHSSVGLLGRLMEGTFGTALGTMITNSVGRAMQFARDQFGQAVKAIGDIEGVSASLASLLSRELVDSGQFDSLKDARATAIKQGEEMFETFEQLAIQSPFSQEDIVGVYQMGLTFELTSKEAENLSRIIVDFGAATNKGGDAMNSIMLALGQVRVQGKLTGAEVRQLANQVA